jgi:pyruvate dehydrogenase E1 component beta subunit
MKTNYGNAILQGFEYLMENHQDVFLIGQGLWSPWYVGTTMTDLDVKFGKERVIDTPVSESACTSAAIGASLAGMKPVVIHPRIDFMLYAMDGIVNQAAKWSYMFGGQSSPNVTFRGIINRGGEQGAQHSQALHSLFAHIPGLRVVMPSTVADARDLLIASVLCPDPVVYIDDRWLYSLEDELGEVVELDLAQQGPQCLRKGDDLTLVASGYSTSQALTVSNLAAEKGVNVEIIDLRVLNPLNNKSIIKSVKKTGRLLVVDGGWENCGIAGEVIASVVGNIEINCMKKNPMRLTLPPAPAPTSRVLEKEYYLSNEKLLAGILKILKK